MLPYRKEDIKRNSFGYIIGCACEVWRISYPFHLQDAFLLLGGQWRNQGYYVISALCNDFKKGPTIIIVVGDLPKEFQSQVRSNNMEIKLLKERGEMELLETILSR